MKEPRGERLPNPLAVVLEAAATVDRPADGDQSTVMVPSDTTDSAWLRHRLRTTVEPPCWRPRSLVMVRRRFVGSVWHWLVVMSVSGEFGGGFLGGGVVDEVFAGGGGGDERGGGGVVELAG